MGLWGFHMAYYGGLQGILSGLTQSTDHPSASRFGLRSRGWPRNLALDHLLSCLGGVQSGGPAW